MEVSTKNKNESRKKKAYALLSFFYFCQQRHFMTLCSNYAIKAVLNNNIGIRRRRNRSCKRFVRNYGWFSRAYEYNDYRFKATFRVTKETFKMILNRLAPFLKKQDVTEQAVTPEERLGIALYKLSRGDYYNTISEMTGWGLTTVRNITLEVCNLIITHLWNDFVTFPSNEQEILDLIVDMEELWQFPYAFGAIDGTHISIKCPFGGAEAKKEYYNFKIFYSIVVMSMVDAKCRFLWASAGFPGNTHDATIFKATAMYEHLSNNMNVQMGQTVDDVNVQPQILGDSAFPHTTWLQKPFSNANLTEQQQYFNYRLSRARMIVECAYGQLKGRWRILERKCESDNFSTRSMALACIVLHNICIAKNDQLPAQLDLSIDPATLQRRPRDVVRNLLDMTRSVPAPNTNKQAAKVRNCLMRKFWSEKQQ